MQGEIYIKRLRFERPISECECIDRASHCGADVTKDPFEEYLLDRDTYEFENSRYIEASVGNASGPLDIEDFIFSSFE